jgi:hypothetical protein
MNLKKKKIEMKNKIIEIWISYQSFDLFKMTEGRFS